MHGMQDFSLKYATWEETEAQAVRMVLACHWRPSPACSWHTPNPVLDAAVSWHTPFTAFSLA